MQQEILSQNIWEENFYERYRDEIFSLNLEFNLLGLFLWVLVADQKLYLKDQISFKIEIHKKMVPVTAREVTEFFIEKGICTVPTTKVRQFSDNLIHRFDALRSKSLVAKIPVDSSEELKKRYLAPAQSSEGKKRHIYTTRFVYTITNSGLRLLRYIYPYTELFERESLLPVSIENAKKALRSLMSRKKSLSTATIKRICLVRRLGRNLTVLKRTPNNEMTELFPDFPMVSSEDIETYLHDQGIGHAAITRIVKYCQKGGEKFLYRRFIYRLL